MTTNFALSLSFEGIRLFHRVPDGWHLVGETALDVDDLAAVLAGLRKDALRLDPNGIKCKILISNDQIKFVTLETAQTEIADVTQALEGATPYPIDELAVDFDRNGGRTFIAAVARETLAEAEAFATEYGFDPVCFAAVPEHMTFREEVFFGPTSVANGGAVARDAVPVSQTGVASIPPDPDATPIFTPRARMADPATIVPAVTPAIKQPDPAPAPPIVAAPAPAGPAPQIDTVTETTAPMTPEVIAQIGGFTSRRSAAAPVMPAPQPEAPQPEQAAKPTRKELRKQKKAAAFATKQAQPVRGKPKFLGLILTIALIIFMGLVALWASTLSEEDVANWFGFGTGGIVETAEIPPPEIAPAVAPIQPDVAVAAPIETAPTQAVLPQIRKSQVGRVLSPAEANRIYAATGVWQRAPRLPLVPRTDELTVVVPKVVNTGFAVSQPVLPQDAPMAPDLAMLAPVNPLPPGTDFDRDANGLVKATPQGALTPQGVLVFARPPPRKPPLRTVAAPEVVAPRTTPDGDVIVIVGRPAVIPPLRPTVAALPAPEETAPAVDLALAGLRPKLRPSGLAPAPAPVVDTALAGFRPKTRPDGLAPEPTPEPVPTGPDISDVVAAIAQAAPASTLISPTARAVAASSRPDTRPRNFARVVARARDLEAQQAARAAAAQPAAVVSNAPAASSGRVPGSVSQAATLNNAIRLRDVNLIGVYGTSNSRRALVRLGNGRFVKVEVGSRLDGGRVTAIGDSVLNYVKRGKTISLQLPTG